MFGGPSPASILKYLDTAKLRLNKSFLCIAGKESVVVPTCSHRKRLWMFLVLYNALWLPSHV